VATAARVSVLWSCRARLVGPSAIAGPDTLEPLAADKKLGFKVEVAPQLLPAVATAAA